MYDPENKIITTENIPLTCKGGVGEICFQLMKSHGDNIFEIDASTGEEETFKAALTKSIRISILLRNKGVQKGDRVVIYSKIQFNASIPLLACFFIGAIPIFLDIEMTVPESLNLLKQAEPKFILTCTQMEVDSYRVLQKEIKSDTDTAVYDKEYCVSQEGEDEFEPIHVSDMKETAFIVFSSGSTGLPKGIRASHYSTLRRTQWVCQTDYNSEVKVIFSYDSFSWCIEILRLLFAIKKGICRLVDPQPFSGRRTWSLLEKYKVNIFYTIPWFVIDMISTEKPESITLRSLHKVVILGSKLLKKHHTKFQEMVGGADVFRLYGLTEGGPLTTLTSCETHRVYNREKPETVGVPQNGLGTSFKVVDIDTNKVVGPNQTGELRVKSDALMSGYHNKDSSDQYDEDGWFKTGDLVYYDEDLCFFTVGRIKDLIIFQGWHVPPVFLEDVLLSHPAVQTAVVVGVPHEVDGEHPLGLVALEEGFEDVKSSDIEAYAAEKLPDKFQLRAGVKIIDKSYFVTGRKLKKYSLKRLVLSGAL